MKKITKEQLYHAEQRGLSLDEFLDEINCVALDGLKDIAYETWDEALGL